MPRRFGGPNGYGHVPDPDGHVRTSVHVHLARVGFVGESTPDAVSHRQFGPGVFDQGPTSSCTGHAVSGAICATLGRGGTPLVIPPSPNGIYKVGRCIDRVRVNGTLPPLVDAGAMPNQIMRGVTEFGVSGMGVPPQDGRYSDVDPNTVNEEPDLGELEDAAEFELAGEYAISPFDPNFVLLVRAAIASGLCVCFCTFVDTAGPRSVEGWDPRSGPLSAPNTSDPHGGLHYIYADGYRTNNGETIVEWVNSWGKGWGLSGYGEGDESFLRAWSNAVAMKIRRPAFKRAA